MALSIYSAEQTHPGKKRLINQDYVASFPPDRLEDIEASGNIHVLADGVGGASQGERASKYAAMKVRSEYYKFPEVPPEERLRKIIRKVGNEIYHYAKDSVPRTRMATTIVVAVIINDELIVAHVGDSRAYIFRNGEPKQITRDHSIVGEMVRDGELTEVEAMHSRIKNRISRSVGGELDVEVDVTKKRIPLLSGDKILLCSDGITRYATKEQLAKIIHLGNPEDVVKRLINYANRRGGADNISAIFIELGEPVPEGAPTIGVGGQLPEDVDWNLMETEPFSVYQDNSWFPINRKMVPFAFVFISIFIAGIWISSIALSSNKQSSSEVATKDILFAVNSTLTSDVKNIAEESQSAQFSSLTTLAETPTNSPTPTYTQTIPTSTSSPTITPTSTSSPHTPTNQIRTSTPTSSNTQSQTPTLTPFNNKEMIYCEYKISKNLPNADVVQITKEIFKFEVIGYVYFEEVFCSVKDNSKCVYDGINNPHYGEYGWILVFPDVQYLYCIDGGGAPYSP